MQKRSFLSRFATGLVLLALAGACDSPPRPSPPNPNRLEIASTTAVAPQQTIGVQAFLITPDGTRQDVTARVTWTTSDPAVLAVSSGGRVTGGAMGEATLRANLDDRWAANLSASTGVIVVPAGTFRLAGIVRASGSTTPLAGAHVQLISESGGTLATGTAGAAGFRFYGVAGRTRLRISRPGFHSYEAEIDIHDHLTHDVSLSAIKVAGTYALTLSASSRCRLELPEDMRTRTSTATIDQVDGSLMVTLQYPSPQSWGQPNTFTGWFGGTNEVMFELGYEEWWLERGAEFQAHGTITSTISAAGLSGFLDGDIEAIVTNEGGRGNRRITCTAPDHGVMFSR